MTEKSNTFEGKSPEDFNNNLLLKSLLLDSQGNWREAHEIAMTIKTLDGSLLHAYLHRKEGDISNAEYWYTKAKSSRPEITLDEEWQLLVDKWSRLS